MFTTHHHQPLFFLLLLATINLLSGRINVPTGTCYDITLQISALSDVGKIKNKMSITCGYGIVGIHGYRYTVSDNPTT